MPLCDVMNSPSPSRKSCRQTRSYGQSSTDKGNDNAGLERTRSGEYSVHGTCRATGLKNCSYIVEHSVGQEQGHSRYKLCQEISERYQKTLYVEYADGFPTRYCFSESRKSSDQQALFEIDQVYDLNRSLATLPDAEIVFVFADYQNSWRNLSKKGKAALCRLLNTPRFLCDQLKYLLKDDTWIDRDTHDVGRTCPVLKDYGHPGNTYCSFTELLTADLTPEEFSLQRSLKLEQRWSVALRTGMGDGDGGTAIFQLLDEIVDLLPEMNISTPVEVLHNTNISKDDGSVMSNCSSTTSEKTSKPSASSPCEGNAQESEGNPRRHLPDIDVICRDPKSSCAKYLARIEVFSGQSGGEREVKAEQKFLKEVMSVLQSQDAVFGFLFSASKVFSYYTKREVTGEIKIHRFCYPIARLEPLQSQGTLHVGGVQMLIMDLLSVLLYGIDNFNV